MTVPVSFRIVVLALAIMALLSPGSASGFFTQTEAVQRVSPSNSDAKQITVSCPSGKRVVGAGAELPLSGDVLIDAIRPNDSLTRVTARAREDESGTEANWHIVAYAMCAPAPGGLELRTATSASTSAAKGITAACPGSKRVLGAGGEITSPNGQVLLTEAMPNVTLTQTTVEAVEDETGNAGTWTVTAYAICSDPVAGLEAFTKTTESASSSTQNALEACPQGKVPLSAGGSVDSSNGQVMLTSMFLDTVFDLATARAAEDDTGVDTNWTLTVRVVCAAEAERRRGFEPRTATGPINRALNCGAGQFPTGGGAEISGAVGQAWLRGVGFEAGEFFATSAPDETGVPSPFEMEVYGICATAIADLVVVTASSLANSFSPKQQVATCPEGLRVLGAGGSTTNNANFVLQAIRPDAGLMSVTATASEDGTGSGARWRLTAFAVCAPPPAGLQLVDRSAPVGSEEFETVTATCPKGKHLTGSGAEIVDGLGRVGFDDIRPDEALTRTSVAAAENELTFGPDWRLFAYSICIDR